MYKVVIIDDEPWIIEGMKKIVPWEKEGFIIAGDAMDAYEGIEKIHELKPDVVFVDIRIPEMSGIEMIRKVREYGYDIEFIVISGYSDFTYAKESISLGVLEYILKPIDKNQLIKVLHKLAAKLQMNQKMQYFNNNELLEQLSQGSNRQEQAAMILRQLGVSHGLPIKRTAFIRSKQEAFMGKTENLEGITLTGIPIGMNFYFVTMAYDHADEYRLSDVLKRQIGDDGNAGVSREMDGIDLIHRSIREAELAANNEFIWGKGNVFFYKKPDYYTVMRTADEITKAITNMDFSAGCAYTESFKDIIIQQKWGVEELVFFYNFLLQNMIKEKGESEEEITDFLTADSIVRDFKDFDEFMRFIHDIITDLEDSKISETFIKYNETIKNIIAYIHRHYYERIRLTDLANQFFINANYLSIIFRKTTGKTFSQYLAEIRMKNACELLKNTDMSIEEICYNVGYTDYYGFIKAFKRLYGITPSKFKNET